MFEDCETAVKLLKTVKMALAAALLAAVALAAGRALGAKAEYKMKIGSLVTPQSVWGRVVDKIIRDVEKQTGGRLDIEHLHSGMLGGDNSMVEMVMHGGIQAAGVPSSSLATVVPEMHIIELPFLFEDYEEAHYIIDNVIEPHIMKKLETKGLMSSAILENGMMEFVAPRFIHKPEDLKDLKIGCWETPVHISFWKSLGANPIPIPATEVLNAYARGRVNSGANSYNALIAWDHLFGTAIKRKEIFITNVKFSYQAGILVMNKKTWQTLPRDVQKDIAEGLRKLTPAMRAALKEADPKSRRELLKRGYNIADMPAAEKAIFIKKAKPVYKKMEKEIGKSFLDRVLRERDKYRKGRKAK